ncbi:hypothetical protein DFH07DRAFT_811647 [Mycena maculata]|uniref:Uncharacterized protein n=1 Tax=Mycena maculata TaxID=230809 RepID=A0AAD7JKQ3_9AGAR|nr:hypothetical protein DFH07DRAFT_811647 [Mycena maculata]
MGNVHPRQFHLHRFLALAICHSSAADPRRLEHYNYTYWTAEAAAFLVRGHLKHCLVAPQLPIYVSPKESVSADADTSRQTAADGDAKGVCVDIAILLPITEPRFPEDLGELGPRVAGKSLAYFFNKILPHLMPGISPRCVRVIGLEAPVLGELKKLPPRHAMRIGSFRFSLIRLLNEATLQAEAQATCLFCSSRFGTQDEVLLLAGAGDCYQIRRVSREWSWTKLPQNKKFTSDTLDELYEAANEEGVCVEETEEDDDWTEGKEGEMYDDPRKAKDIQKELREQRVKEQIEQRKKRAEERARKRDAQYQQLQDALGEPPSTDRTVRLFSDAALNAVHRQATGADLFEFRAPETYFGKSRDTDWSGVLQLGSDLSNAYMEKIQDFIRTFEDREDGRRENVFFANYLDK